MKYDYETVRAISKAFHSGNDFWAPGMSYVLKGYGSDQPLTEERMWAWGVTGLNVWANFLYFLTCDDPVRFDHDSNGLLTYYARVHYEGGHRVSREQPEQDDHVFSIWSTLVSPILSA